MKTPTHLSHKPIIGIDDYDQYDGQFAFNTDAKALSVGIAQYDVGEDDISVKVFRYSGEKWSRQSEELPLHRVVDLNTILLQAVLRSDNISYTPTTLKIRVIDADRLSELKHHYISNRSNILPKLQELKKVLDEFLLNEASIR